MSTDFRCQCTVHNTSKHDLVNVEYGQEWGKWSNPNDGDKGSNPPSVIKAGTSGWWLLSGRSGSWSGAEGWVKYEVGTYGIIQFNFDCPFSGDNKASCDVSAPVEYRVYAISEKGSVGEKGPDTTVSDYGSTEGSIPPKGHPLSLLWVISDLEE